MRKIILILLFVTNIYSQHVLQVWNTYATEPPGPYNIINLATSFWKMDELSGVRYDFIGTNDLADSNTTVSEHGVVNQGANVLAADNNFFTCDDNASLSIGDRSFSISFWVKPQFGFATDQFIVSKWKDAGTQREYMVWYDYSELDYAFSISEDGTVGGTVADTVWTTGCRAYVEYWNFVVAWYDAAADSFGISAYEPNVSGTLGIQHFKKKSDVDLVHDGATQFRIGSQSLPYDDSYSLDGIIDDVGFWPFRLTKLQMDTLMARSQGGAYWSFEETANARRDSVGSNYMYLNGTVSYSSSGLIGNAVDFETDHDEDLYIYDNPRFVFANTSFTVGCWINMESLVTAYFMGEWEASAGNREWGLYYSTASSQFKFSVSANGTDAVIVVATAPSPAVVGTWYFLCAWHDADVDSIGISVNDGTVYKAAHSTGLYERTVTFRIGSSDAYDVDGLMDEAFIYRRRLTKTEITSLYNGGAGRQAYNAPAP